MAASGTLPPSSGYAHRSNQAILSFVIEPLHPPIETASGAVYRELTPEEIKSVEGVFLATGNPLPDPAISTFVGVVEGGEVVAFLVLQLKLHAQPMWIKEGHSQVFSPLVSEAERTIVKKLGSAWVYLFTPAGKLSQLAQAAGMQMEPWVVHSKLVQQELPRKIGVDLLPIIDPPSESEAGDTIQ